MSRGTLLTIADIDRMLARGEFDPPEEHRVELIRGELRQMSPIGDPHIDAVMWLTNWSYRSIDPDEFRIMVQGAIEIPALESMPQPDLVWARQGRGRPNASEVLVVIEVADSTVKNDIGLKAQLYAEGGIQDYWVIDIPGRQVHVFREPTETGYASHTTHGEGMKISPLAVPDVELVVAELFAE